MSRIPNSAIPHAWAEDSEHAEEVRRARGETRDEGVGTALWIAAGVGLAALALKLLWGRRSHA
jgi:hypothetical protein